MTFIFRVFRLVSAFVLSRLGYCNAESAGLPQTTLLLQRVQNAAARLTTPAPI